MIAAFFSVALSVGIIVALSVYSLLSWSYVCSLIWAWAVQPQLGIALGFEFFVGAVALLMVAKTGLSSSLDGKEGAELATLSALLLVAPWTLLLTVWLVLS